MTKEDSFLNLKKRYKEIGEIIHNLSIERDSIVDGFLAVCSSCSTDDGEDCRTCIYNMDSVKDNLRDNWRK